MLQANINVSQKNNQFEIVWKNVNAARARTRALRSHSANISKTVRDILINFFPWKVLALGYMLGNIWILI